MKTLGLYLHFPFCRSKCAYCDFCSQPLPKEETVRRYVAALCLDLETRARQCREYEVDTVYFGGGTPTFLFANALKQILSTVQQSYRLSPDAEITAECNPATADLEKLTQMRRAGFNRLSIGLQSAQEGELRALGRAHTFEDFCRTWRDARAAGFENLSADVMFGIPHQSIESFRDTLNRLCALSPDHVSAYSLTVEEGTPFGRMGAENLSLPSEDETRAMYMEMTDILAKHGIFQYEISNFARRGYESRHNLKYWRCKEYLGFGPAAYSDFGGERFGNGRDLDGYLSGRDICIERETPSEKERKNEHIMLGLRLNEGIDRESFSERFGEDAWQTLFDEIWQHERAGFSVCERDRVFLTRQGMLVSNAILCTLLDFDD